MCGRMWRGTCGTSIVRGKPMTKAQEPESDHPERTHISEGEGRRFGHAESGAWVVHRDQGEVGKCSSGHKREKCGSMSQVGPWADASRRPLQQQRQNKPVDLVHSGMEGDFGTHKYDFCGTLYPSSFYFIILSSAIFKCMIRGGPGLSPKLACLRNSPINADEEHLPHRGW
jgi:hypothetical protein